jgi:3-deoxy-D-manno-octulosonic acid kinase
MTGHAPPGYQRFLTTGGAEVVARTADARAVRETLAGSTLYEWAERQPGARALYGRGTSYAVALPATGPDAPGARVVVRHARHGGLLAPLTGDRFLGSTRAPRELDAALRLAAAGVPTPEVVAYVLYPAGTLMRRADVATREIEGRDLATVLEGGPSDGEQEAALAATAGLLGALARAGARHSDLNIKNVLLAPNGNGGLLAWVLDVDVVRFRAPDDPAAAWSNVARIERSFRKRGSLRAAGAAERDVARLRELAAPLLPPPPKRKRPPAPAVAPDAAAPSERSA